MRRREAAMAMVMEGSKTQRDGERTWIDVMVPAAVSRSTVSAAIPA